MCRQQVPTPISNCIIELLPVENNEFNGLVPLGEFASIDYRRENNRQARAEGWMDGPSLLAAKLFVSPRTDIFSNENVVDAFVRHLSPNQMQAIRLASEDPSSIDWLIRSIQLNHDLLEYSKLSKEEKDVPSKGWVGYSPTKALAEDLYVSEFNVVHLILETTLERHVLRIREDAFDCNVLGGDIETTAQDELKRLLVMSKLVGLVKDPKRYDNAVALLQYLSGCREKRKLKNRLA